MVCGDVGSVLSNELLRLLSLRRIDSLVYPIFMLSNLNVLICTIQSRNEEKRQHKYEYPSGLSLPYEVLAGKNLGWILFVKAEPLPSLADQVF